MGNEAVTVTGWQVRQCLRIQRWLLDGLAKTVATEGERLMRKPLAAETVSDDIVIEWPPKGLPMTKGCDEVLDALQACPVLDVAAALRYLVALQTVSWTALGDVPDDHRFTAMVDTARG